MIPLLTAAQSSALDDASAKAGVGVDALMENAGGAVAAAVGEILDRRYGRRVIGVCGKGNNGGDGLVALRHLQRRGVRTTAVLVNKPRDLKGEAAANLRRYLSAGGTWRASNAADLRRQLRRADVVIDAVFGTGFSGAPRGTARTALAAVDAAGLPVVSVDVPSGVDGDTGAVAGQAVHATITVTFGGLKPGLVLHPGAAFVGEARVVDIGFPEGLVRSDAWLVEAEDVSAVVTPREPSAHKRSAVVMVVAGSRTMSGAAALAARGAYRAGAGLVTVAAPHSVLPVLQPMVPEATYVPLPETAAGTLADEAVAELLERFEEVDAVAVGPGLGRQEETARAIRRLAQRSTKPLVLDADGLNAFVDTAGELGDRRSEAVLTPHAGEFGRLLGIEAGDVAGDRLGLARKAAASWNAVILLKGPSTVVAEPSGAVRVNPTGGPALASAGTGDVLTGAIAALIARGASPADAAVAAAYVHGAAGDVATAEVGEGVVASDVVDRIPAVIAALPREA